MGLAGDPRKGAEAGQQLTVGERTAFLDREPSMMTVALVVGTHVVREVVDDLAVMSQSPTRCLAVKCASVSGVVAGPQLFTTNLKKTLAILHAAPGPKPV